MFLAVFLDGFVENLISLGDSSQTIWDSRGRHGCAPCPVVGRSLRVFFCPVSSRAGRDILCARGAGFHRRPLVPYSGAWRAPFTMAEHFGEVSVASEFGAVWILQLVSPSLACLALVRCCHLPGCIFCGPIGWIRCAWATVHETYEHLLQF